MYLFFCFVGRLLAMGKYDTLLTLLTTMHRNTSRRIRMHVE